MARPATSEAAYAKVVKALLPHKDVTYSRNTLWVNRKMFAYCTQQGNLTVKLPPERVDALIAKGTGKRFDAGPGRQVKEWLTLDPALEKSWLPLAREALRFANPRTKR